MTLYSYTDSGGDVPFYVNHADPLGFGIKPIHAIFRNYKDQFDPYKVLDDVKFQNQWSIDAKQV